MRAAGARLPSIALLPEFWARTASPPRIGLLAETRSGGRRITLPSVRREAGTRPRDITRVSLPSVRREAGTRPRDVTRVSATRILVAAASASLIRVRAAIARLVPARAATGRLI
jgi:hypothetical protein